MLQKKLEKQNIGWLLTESNLMKRDIELEIVVDDIIKIVTKIIKTSQENNQA